MKTVGFEENGVRGTNYKNFISDSLKKKKTTRKKTKERNPVKLTTNSSTVLHMLNG